MPIVSKNKNTERVCIDGESAFEQKAWLKEKKNLEAVHSLVMWFIISDSNELQVKLVHSTFLS